MTLEELKEYLSLINDEKYYMFEINRLKDMRDEEISYYPSPQLTTIPGNNYKTSPTERIALLSVEFKEKIDKQIKECEEALETVRNKLAAIDEFIENIEDHETRSMMRRHIKQDLSYRQLAKEFYISRNSVARRIKSAFK